MKTQATPQINAEGQRGSFNLNLSRQSIFSVPDAAAVRILCTEGAIWITLDDSPEDVVLQRCGDYTAPEHRRAVVYALQPSKVTVSALAAKPRTNAPVEAKPSLRERIWPSLGLQMGMRGLGW